MQRLKLSIVVMLALVIGVTAAFAQTSNGTIAGTVVDPSGAAITNANVTAKSVQNGDTRTTKTNSVGGYRLDSLFPGVYVVTIDAAGFSKMEVKDVRVSGSVVTAVNPTLKLGSTETISVEANGAVLQTETGEISQTISEADIHELPIPNLNPYALATTLPGVTTVSAAKFTNGTAYSVNGTRPRANNYLIEGQDNNDAGIHGQGLQPENLDAVKEVILLTNSYSAEFGHGGGSVANLIYKSGGNSFHGSGWDLLNNSALDAIDKGNWAGAGWDPKKATKTKYRENIFGFTFGGPIKKDKLFFFTSYQWDKYRASAVGGLLTVPTANGVATLQALDAANPNPRIKALLSAIGPMRGVSNVSNIALGNSRPAVEVGQVRRTGIGTQAESPEFDAKGDYIISRSDTLNLRYVRTHYSSPYDFGNFPSQLPGFDNQQDGVAHNAGFSEIHTFSNTLINEFRASYGRIGFSFLPRADQLNRADGLGTGPTISITSLTGFGGSQSVPQGRFHNTYQLQDSVSWSVGKHFLKMGVDFADVRVVDRVPYNFYGAINYGSSTSGGSFTGLANYIDDFSGKSTTVSRTFGSPIVRPRLFSQNYFMQDTWKLRSNLSVDLGVRYEYNGAPANSLKYPAFDPDDPFPACFGATFSCDPIKQEPDASNFGPRVGFAYTPHFLEKVFGGDKTVIRGGFGVFYDGIFTNIVDNTQAASPNSIGGSITGSTSGRGTANWSQVFTTVSPIYSPKSTQTTMIKHLLSPETLQWNLSMQRALPAHFTATLGYVGTRGEHLYGQDFMNPINPATGTFYNTSRGQIIYRDNSGDSIYHGLQAELDRKFSKGLLFRAAYTYSKLMDDVAEVFTTGNFSTYPMIQRNLSGRKAVDFGVSPYDHRQRLALSYVYSIPTFRSFDNYAMKGLRHLTEGWQLSGTTAFQSGNPVNVQIGYDVNGDGITNDRPSLGNPNAPMTSFGWDPSWGSGVPAGYVCPGAQFYNGAQYNSSGSLVAFSCTAATAISADSVHWIVPAYGTNGTLGRNALIVHGTQTWNLGITRDIKVHEGQTLQFRTEMLNPFNHGNTGTPGINGGSASLVTGVPLFNPTKPNNVVPFMNYALTDNGGRSIRFWLKYSF